MTGFTDHQAAARAGVDQSARQSGYPLFPAGWDAMDVERHTVACSWNFTTPKKSWQHWKTTCGDCGKLLLAETKAELDRLAREHTT